MCILDLLCNDIRLIVYRYVNRNKFDDVTKQYRDLFIDDQLGHWSEHLQCFVTTDDRRCIANWRTEGIVINWRTYTLVKEYGPSCPIFDLRTGLYIDEEQDGTNITVPANY